MGHPRVPIDPVADLTTRLHRDATGMSISKIRGCTRGWWSDHGFADHPTAVGKRVALALIEQAPLTAKLAGTLVLQDLGPHLRAADVPAFARLFTAGHLADWQVVDAFSMKVLVTLLDRVPGRRDVVRALSTWRGSDVIWQRRAACLAFVKLAPLGEVALAGLVDQLLAIAATVVWSHERADQNAVGWLLGELGRVEPARVETFFRRHALLMSRECARHVVAKFPPARRADLLAHHKRATSLRS